MPESKPFAGGVAKNTVIVAILVALVNICYGYFYNELTGYSFSETIDSNSIFGASLLAILLAGAYFYFLSRWVSKYYLIYISSVIGITIFSILAPLSPELPNGTPTPVGFFEYTAPMHLLVGFSAAIFIPGRFRPYKYFKKSYKIKIKL